MTDQNKQSKRSRGGYTLAEVLMAILILMLATAIVAAGIPAAVRAYNNVVDAANAEVLLSTTMIALRDELGSAEGFVLDSNGYLKSYRSATLQGRNAQLKNSGDSGIVISYSGVEKQQQLVSVKATTEQLHAKSNQVGDSDETVKISHEKHAQGLKVSGLQVVRNSDGVILTSAPETYLIRPMNPTIIEDSES